MVKFSALYIFAIAGFVLFPLLQFACAEFKIDYEQNTFVLDGKPYRYISGSVHYFRVPRAYWRDRLRKLRAAGLNAVSTYVEWSAHEHVPGEYNFTGDLDVSEFIKIAQEEDLHVILRPGPYICAERDMGGLPYWLLQMHPDIYLRSSDANYLKYVERWINVLFEELQPLWNGNGGPIILVQVENEYGSYPACDRDYTSWLANIFQQQIKDNAVLFTTDGGDAGYLKCGKIPGVYATVDFGPGTNITKAFGAQRQYEPNGPLVNSEFYPGWLTHWGERMANVATSNIVKTLREMLDAGANVNFYMFYGGTNFGFTAGANYGSNYQADIQSYDYDAPITEAGDLTEKYYEIQKVIAEYMPLPNITVETAAKGDYGEITLQASASLFSSRIRSNLGRVTQKDYPTTFESVGQNFGYLLYETSLPASSNQELLVEQFNDLAHVYVNELLIGNLSRELKTNTVKLPDTAQNDKLSIVVENLGRINFGGMNNDSKGILSNVTLGGEPLVNWDQTSFEFDNLNGVEECYLENKERRLRKQRKSEDCFNGNGFIFYVTKFQINEGSINGKKAAPLDTYLDVTSLSKGLVYVNGVNIGRYWPVRGPQYTIYIPGIYLKNYPEENIIVVMEEEIRDEEIKISFTTSAIFTRSEPKNFQIWG